MSAQARQRSSSGVRTLKTIGFLALALIGSFVFGFVVLSPIYNKVRPVSAASTTPAPEKQPAVESAPRHAPTAIVQPAEKKPKVVGPTIRLTADDPLSPIQKPDSVDEEKPRSSRRRAAANDDSATAPGATIDDRTASTSDESAGTRRGRAHELDTLGAASDARIGDGEPAPRAKKKRRGSVKANTEETPPKNVQKGESIDP